MEWAVVDEPSVGPERKPGFQAGDVLGIIAGLLIVLLVGAQLLAAAMELFGQGLETPAIGSLDLWLNSVGLLVIFGVLPFLWIWTTRQHGWQGTIEYFQLRRPLWGLLWGSVLTIGLFVVLMVLGLIMMALDSVPENPALDDIAKVLSWPLVIAISLSAAFGEEILFRGIVQRYTGWWGQAIIFGLLHAYQGVYGIILTGLLGLLFGYIVKRRWGLWVPIVAHFLFDFVQLSILLVAPEAAA